MAEISRYDALIEVSARLFHEQGFDRTSVRDIAAAAGITSGSIFYHFKSKEEILVSVIEVGMRRGYEDVKASLASTKGARPRLRMLFLSHLRGLHGPSGHYHQIWLREMGLLPPAMALAIKALSRDYRKVWLTVLEEATQAGLIAGDSRIFRKVAIGALNSTTFWVHSPSDIQIEQLADLLLAALLNEPAALPPGFLDSGGHVNRG